LYRLVDREQTKGWDIRPYPPSDISAPLAAPADRGTAAIDGEEELAAVDLSALLPYLLLIAAGEKAQALVAEAEATAQSVRQAAQKEGGERGREEAKQEIMPSLIAFRDAGQALIVFEERLVSRSAPWIASLAVDIAEKVVGQAVEANSEIVASILERAKREVVEAKQLRIWLHPADHTLLAEMHPDLIAVGADPGRKIEVLAAEDIGRGGCRLESEMGLVDATLPTQIAEIRRQLLDDGAPALPVDQKK